jgi:integrase/recombinase XerD
MRKRNSVDRLLSLVQSFFTEYLQKVRGASPHTIAAYQDSLRLFFLFLADATGHSVSRLRLNHITTKQVVAFLEHLEHNRCNSVATRNCRLAVLHSFCQHLTRQDPSRSSQYQQILSLPMKKAQRPTICYLEPEEMRILLRQPDRRTTLGIRDFALLLFLYNTGARVSEALGVRWHDITLRRPRQVRLHGKGSKDRFCPLWSASTSALKQLNFNGAGDEHVFRNARGDHLSRDGVALILNKYVRLASTKKNGLHRKKITPHTLRHSCAVALLQSGIDLTVIRDYLGHESISSTGRYVTTNMQTKRRVLEAFWEHSGLRTRSSNNWKPTPALLTLLSSL